MTTGQLAFQGVADETSLSAGSSGGTGDTTTVQGVATGSVLHVDEDVQYGGYPYVRLDQASGSACTWRAALTPGASGQATAQFRVKTPASWASASHMVGYLTQTTSTQACRAVIGGTASAGQVRLVNTSGTTVASSSGPAVLANSTDYVFELSCTPNGTSGTARLKVWNADASSLLYDSGTQTSNFGTGALAYVGWGNGSSTPTVPTMYAGLARWADSITTWNGVSLGTPNVPPSVTMPPNQNVAPGATVSAHAAVSDPDGVVQTTAWTEDAANSSASPALTTPLDVTVGLVAPGVGHLVTLDLAVTDDDGATTNGSTEVRVPITDASDVLPLAIPVEAEVGAWTKVGAQANEGATLASASDSDYMASPALSAVPVSITIRLQPRSVSANGTFKVRMSTAGDGTAHATVTLLEGNTVRQVFATQAIPNNTTPTDYATFTMSPATLAAITDWGNLFLTIAGTS